MSKITIEFTPADGSLSAVGTELTGADVIQSDLEKLASKFDGNIDWGDMSTGAWSKVNNAVVDAQSSAVSIAETMVQTEKNQRISADESTLASAKEFATSADASVLSEAKQYTAEQVAAEANDRDTGDANTLASAKTFATDYTDTEVTAEATARDAAITNATSGLATKSSVADAISNSHTHSNKSVIDTITQTKIDKWDSGGITDYTELTNKPTINGVELTGDKTLNDLGDKVLLLTDAITTKGEGSNGIITAIYDSDSANIIGVDAFQRYSALQEVHLRHVTEIQLGAFSRDGTSTNKYGVRILDIPSVKTLGRGVCQDDAGLELVIFRDIETIGEEAFDCSIGANDRRIFDMTQVTAPPTIGSNAITKTEGLRIVVPKNDINTWKTAEGWSNYADYIFTSPYPR